MTGQTLASMCLRVAREIQDECSQVLDPLVSGAEPMPVIAGCGEAMVRLLARQAGKFRGLHRWDFDGAMSKIPPVDKQLLAQRLDDILSIAYNKFYAYKYEDLPVCWRQMYTDAAILKFCVLRHQSLLGVFSAGAGGLSGEEKKSVQEEITEMVKTLDLAVILAGAAGERRGRSWIEKALVALEEAWDYICELERGLKEAHEEAKRGGRSSKRRKIEEDKKAASNWTDSLSFPIDEPFTPPVKSPIRRTTREEMSLEAFQTYMDRPTDPKRGPEPLIITGLIDDWPARTSHPWCKPDYLLSRTFNGLRLVPVEIGRSYVDEGWGQKLIPFHELLSTYIVTQPSPEDTKSPPTTTQKRTIAYLAQHPLLTQLPSLRSDIMIPDLCYTSPPGHPTDPSQNQPEVDEPKLNAWFGPPGTITPLHTDPYHNLLVQVVGRKYVRLYPPTEGARMWPRGREGGVEMGNTSRWDVGVEEGWDSRTEADGEQGDGEKFGDIPFVDCILGPGDTLYIPIGWWHYVRGLTVSFSVSFWWNGELNSNE